MIIGVGIGGLAAGASLHKAGWDVTVCERAASLEPVGAGLARLIDALLTRVPAGVLMLSTEVTSVEAGGRVVTTAGEMRADLVVAADGIGSAVRSALFPAHPGLRYAGFTTWRRSSGPWRPSTTSACWPRRSTRAAAR